MDAMTGYGWVERVAKLAAAALLAMLTMTASTSKVMAAGGADWRSTVPAATGERTAALAAYLPPNSGRERKFKLFLPK